MSITAEILIRAKNQFSSEIAKAKREFGSLGDFAKNSLAIAGTVTAAAAAVGVFVKHVADYGDAINDARLRTGLAAEQLSALKYAADLSGSSFEGVAQGLKLLSRNAYEAAQGGRAQAEVFRDLGIAVQSTDGSIRPLNDLLLDVADKFVGMTDGAEKAALAQKIFGRSGTDLIPLLNEGSAGLSKLTDEAKKMGLVISDDAAKAADEFNDSLSRLWKTVDGLMTRGLTPLIPILTKTANALSWAAVQSFNIEFGAPGGGGSGAGPGFRRTTSMGDNEAALRFALTAPTGVRPGLSGPGALQSLLGEVVEDMDRQEEAAKKAAEATKKAAEAAAEWAKTLGGVNLMFDRLIREAGQNQRAGFFSMDVFDPSARAAENILSLEALEQEKKAYFDAALQDFRNRTFGSSQESQSSLEFASNKLLQQFDKLENEREDFLRSFRDGAGEVWDSFFIRGQSVLSSLANLARGLLNTIGRTLFQNFATGLFTGGRGGGGGIAGAAGNIGSSFGLGKIFGGAGGGLLSGLFGGGAAASSIPLAAVQGGFVPAIPLAGIGGGAGVAAGGSSMLGAIGAFATNPITLGVAAALGGAIILSKVFGHKTQESLTTRDPNAPGSIEYFYNAVPYQLGRVVDILQGITTMPAGVLVANGLPMAIASSNRFRRQAVSMLMDDV